jgi:hypothetical protein
MSNYNSIDLQPLYGHPQYNSSSGYITPMVAKKRTSKWLTIGIPILVIVIAAAVVGGIFGSKKKNNSSSSSAAAAASSAASAKDAFGRFATATDSEFMVPLYPSTVSHLILYISCRSFSSLKDRCRRIFFPHIRIYQQSYHCLATRPFPTRQSFYDHRSNRPSPSYRPSL